MGVGAARFGLGGLCLLAIAVGSAPTVSGAARHVLVGTHSDPNTLFGTQGVAISPDGAHVYGGSGSITHALLTFGRGPTTGGLRLLDDIFPSDAVTFAISPDGAHVYGGASGHVEVYERDAFTGLLTQIQDPPLFGARVRMSPDGKHLFGVAPTGALDRLHVMSRNPVTGQLTSVETYEDGVDGIDGLDGARDVAVSPDGQNVYVASRDDDAVAVFTRDTVTGELTLVEVQQDGVGGVSGLDDADGVAVSPDGDHLYASGLAAGVGGVAMFVRDSGTGALTFFGHAVGGANGHGTVAVSPDGALVYMAMVDSFKVYERDSASGALIFSEDVIKNVGGVPDLGAEDLVVSPNGRHLYVAGGISVSAFQRVDLSCNDTPLGGCFEPVASEKALLVVKDNAEDKKDKLIWKWSKGDAVTLGDYGDPATTANDYVLCIYDATANPQPIAELLAPAGGGCGPKSAGGDVPCWKAKATKGFSYKRGDTHPDGVVAVKLLTGDAGRAKIVLKAKKSFTPTPGVPMTLPVTVQLQNANGQCWTATYSTSLANENGLFKAKAD